MAAIAGGENGQSQRPSEIYDAVAEALVQASAKFRMCALIARERPAKGLEGAARDQIRASFIEANAILRGAGGGIAEIWRRIMAGGPVLVVPSAQGGLTAIVPGAGAEPKPPAPAEAVVEEPAPKIAPEPSEN